MNLSICDLPADKTGEQHSVSGVKGVWCKPLLLIKCWRKETPGEIPWVEGKYWPRAWRRHPRELHFHQRSIASPLARALIRASCAIHQPVVVTDEHKFNIQHHVILLLVDPVACLSYIYATASFCSVPGEIVQNRLRWLDACRWNANFNERLVMLQTNLLVFV